MHIGQIHVFFLFGYAEVEIIGTLTTVNFKSMEVNVNYFNLSEWGHVCALVNLKVPKIIERN